MDDGNVVGTAFKLVVVIGTVGVVVIGAAGEGDVVLSSSDNSAPIRL